MLALDHIVIAAKNPGKAAEDFAHRFDVKTIEGGKHENWGTYNYLAYFQNDCYIEWLDIFDEAIAKRSENPLIQQLVSAFENGIEGTIQYALRTRQMEDLTSHFDELSINYIGPIPGSRKKPDGALLEWRMPFPKGTSNLPFIIEWGDGVNIPDYPRLINNKRIEVVETPVDWQDMKHIYQTKFSKNSAILENTIIKLNKPLSFELL